MKHLLDDPRIDKAFLNKHGFDEARFLREADLIARGALTEASAVIAKERLAPAPPGATVSVAADGSAEAARFVEAGRAALARGEVANVILNGGMATRFGGVVKGVVEVYGGQSFLSLKAEDVRRAGKELGAPVPFVLMNSFATDEATKRHFEEQRSFDLPSKDVLWFEQSLSIRLQPNGALFIGDDGLPSYHAPGHGDFFRCIRRSGVLGALRDRGVKVLLFSNVDNLGATIDPKIIGYHLLSNADMTAEVTEKRRTASGAWDKGGAPARVDGHLQLVEGFRFAPDFSQELLPDFSTNNMLFSAEGIDREIDLERYVVRKSVDGRPALQLESITCEASGLRTASGEPLLRLALLRVPRDGPSGRFFPIKEPADLETSREVLRERLEQGWQRRRP